MFRIYVLLVIVLLMAFIFFFISKYIPKKYVFLGFFCFFALQGMHMFLRHQGITFDELTVGKAWLLSTGIFLAVFYALTSFINRKKEVFDPSRRTALFAMGAMLPSTYGITQGTRVPDVVYHEFSSHKLKNSSAIKILQVTDMHISGLFGKAWCEDLVAKINKENADIVVFTGDLSDGFLQDRYDDLLPLKNIEAPMYACLGNHEYIYDIKGFTKLFTAFGMRILANESTTLNLYGETINLVGLTDPRAKQAGAEPPDLEKALRDVNTDNLTIMLNHRPSLTTESAAKGVDLQLSGHTHGGQFLGLNGIVKLANEGFLYGWYTIDSMKLYVSSGAALWAGAPFRLGVPSELPVFLLKSEIEYF